jgi:hypothetical protein
MHDINPVFDVGSGAATLRDTQVMKYEAVKGTDCALRLEFTKRTPENSTATLLRPSHTVTLT